MANLHIGKKILQVVNKSGMTKVEFAKKLGVTRAHVYQVFNGKGIKTDNLIKISKILNHNFFKDYSKSINIKK